MNNVLNSALNQTGKKFSVDAKLVEAIYKSYWKFIKEHVNEYSVLDMSEEDFSSTDTNFNIPYIGKLFVEYSKIQKYKRQFNFKQNVKTQKNQANRLSGTSK